MFVFLDHALDVRKDMPRRDQEPVALGANSLVFFERKLDTSLTIPVRALAQEVEKTGPLERGSEPPYPLIHLPEERLVLNKSALLLVHSHKPSENQSWRCPRQRLNMIRWSELLAPSR